MAELTFAPATGEQPEMIGEWLHETAPELLSYLFSGREAALRQLAAHWAMPRGLFSHSHAVLARRGDAVLGLEIGYTEAQKEPHKKDTAERFAADLEPAALAALGARTADIGPLLAPVPDDAYYVEHLVVAPEARGSGCGGALLRRAFDQARSAGLAALHLDVMSNKPAVDFYLAHGMTDTVESRVPRLSREHDMPSVIRMVKTF